MCGKLPRPTCRGIARALQRNSAFRLLGKKKKSMSRRMPTIAERTQLSAILFRGRLAQGGERQQRALWFYAFRQIRAAVRLRDTGRIAQSANHRGNTFAARVRECFPGLNLSSASRLARLLAIELRNRAEMPSPAIRGGFRSASFVIGGGLCIVWRPHACVLRRAGTARDNLEQSLENAAQLEGAVCG